MHNYLWSAENIIDCQRGKLPPSAKVFLLLSSIQAIHNALLPQEDITDLLPSPRLRSSPHFLDNIQVVPTPFVAAGVAVLHAAAGVMVTASHNPKEYNGYKVYWGNGCQVMYLIIR
jgi:hypothetical protein